MFDELWNLFKAKEQEAPNPPAISANEWIEQIKSGTVINATMKNIKKSDGEHEKSIVALTKYLENNQNSTLISLDLSDQLMLDTNFLIENLLQTLSNASQLKHLNLRDISLKSPLVFNKLLNFISINNTLNTLDLSNTYLTDEQAKTLLTKLQEKSDKGQNIVLKVEDCHSISEETKKQIEAFSAKTQTAQQHALKG